MVRSRSSSDGWRTEGVSSAVDENFGRRLNLCVRFCSMRVVENVLELVGQAPMLRLRRLEQAGWPWAEIWARLEFLNPGGSGRDGAALGTGTDGERRGAVRRGGRVRAATG